MHKLVTYSAMLAVVLLAVLAMPPPVAAQCAMCQASLANADGGGVISGFRQGIVLLLVVMGALGGIGWTIVRRARAKYATSQLSSGSKVSESDSSRTAETFASR